MSISSKSAAALRDDSLGRVCSSSCQNTTSLRLGPHSDATNYLRVNYLTQESTTLISSGVTKKIQVPFSASSNRGVGISVPDVDPKQPDLLYIYTNCLPARVESVMLPHPMAKSMRISTDSMNSPVLSASE